MFAIKERRDYLINTQKELELEIAEIKEELEETYNQVLIEALFQELSEAEDELNSVEYELGIYR